STFPAPGNVSPGVARQMAPVGPSRTAVPSVISRSVQPSSDTAFGSGAIGPFGKGGDDFSRLGFGSTAWIWSGDCSCLAAGSLGSGEIAAKLGVGGWLTGAGSGPASFGDTAVRVESGFPAATSAGNDFVTGMDKSRPSDGILFRASFAL